MRWVPSYGIRVMVGRDDADRRRQKNYAYYCHFLLATLTPRGAAIQAGIDLLRELEAEIGEKERSPLLALLEMGKKERKMTDEEWKRDVERYWMRWGNKGCVVSELEGIVGEDKVRVGVVLGMMEKRVSEGHVCVEFI